MKTFDELYPETYPGEWSGHCYGPGDYSVILRAIGNIAVQVDDDDCQGDSRVLYQDGERFGLLLFGWGSCSGCDGLQACSSKAEVEELARGLEAQVKWLPRSEMAAYMRAKDWDLESVWLSNTDASKRFLEQSLALLDAQP